MSEAWNALETFMKDSTRREFLTVSAAGIAAGLPRARQAAETRAVVPIQPGCRPRSPEPCSPSMPKERLRDDGRLRAIQSRRRPQDPVISMCVGPWQRV